jgi:hypothetical protein
MWKLFARTLAIAALLCLGGATLGSDLEEKHEPRECH